MSSATQIDPQQDITMDTTEPHVLDAAVAEHFGKEIAANMASVYVTVKRPCARKRSRAQKIEVSGDTGNVVEVDPKLLTNPGYRFDVHPIWKRLDANEIAIRRLVDVYTANDGRKGDHLIVMTKLPELLAKLTRLRNERLSLVRLMRELWSTEIIPGIRSTYPATCEQIIADLPHPGSLEKLFDVNWIFRPLTPLTVDSIDITQLNDEDRARVIEQSNTMVREMAQTQAQSVFSAVFGEVADLCQRVQDGALESGRRKSAALDDMLLVLERIHNFSTYASPEVIAAADAVKKKLKNLTITQLNTDTAVQGALKAVFGQMKTAIDELKTNMHHRATRSIEV